MAAWLDLCRYSFEGHLDTFDTICTIQPCRSCWGCRIAPNELQP